MTFPSVVTPCHPGDGEAFRLAPEMSKAAGHPWGYPRARGGGVEP